jgi:hypothetical protein
VTGKDDGAIQFQVVIYAIDTGVPRSPGGPGTRVKGRAALS